MRVDKFTARRFVVFLPLAIALLWAGSWGVGKAVEPPAYSCSVRSVTVQNDDTIDSLARRHCSGEVLEVIDLLVAMYGTAIEQGQTLDLPIASPR